MILMTRLCSAILVLALLPSAVSGQIDSDQAYSFILGKMAAENNDYPEALLRMERVVSQNPRNPVVLYERALLFLGASQVDRGEAELRQLLQNYPDFYDARRLLGRVLLDGAEGDAPRAEEALLHLKEAYRLYPADLSSGVTVSQILLSLGRTEEAQKVLASLLEQSPDNRMLNFTYSQVLTKLGRGDESLPFLERVVTMDPTYGPAVFQLVDIYQKANQWMKAAEALQPLVSKDPLNLDLQRQQGFFYLRAGESEKARARLQELAKSDPKDDRTAFYLAEALADLLRYEEADAIYLRLLRNSPNDPDLLSSYGVSLLAQRKFDEAERMFRSVLTIDRLPSNFAALARTQLALVALQQGDYPAALQQARTVLTYDGKLNLQAINIALDSLRREKRYEEGRALLEPLVREFAGEPYVQSRYVEFLLLGGRREDARKVAEKQLAQPNRRSLGVIDAYSLAKEWDEGIRLLEQVRLGDPTNRDVIFQLASFYERSGNEQKAEKMFEEILRREPDHGPTLNYLGYMWADKGVKLDRSSELLEKAVRLDPQNGAYVDSLGWVYYRLGKLDLSERYLSEAARLIPRDPTIQAHLGDVFLKKGEYKKALERYRTALELKPDPDEEAELRTKIAEAEKRSATPVH